MKTDWRKILSRNSGSWLLLVALFQTLPIAAIAASHENPSQAALAADVRDTFENPAMRPIEDTPGLPRVLLIGDSISIGYTVPVRELLKGIANVQRIPGNGGPTINGLQKLDTWLGTNRWDVIHFNWGLHDLKIDANGRHQVELEPYERNLERLLDRLERTGATLVWATTTPVPEHVKGPARVAADVPRYNESALRVMEAANIRINDLFAFASPRLPQIQLTQNVHFTTGGSTELARPVARAIQQALKQRRHSNDRGALAPGVNREEIAAGRQWLKKHLAIHGRQLPFAFKFDSRLSSDFLWAWTAQSAQRRLDEMRTERTFSWSDSRSGLVVRLVAVEYADFPVIEWTVYFKNASSIDTPILEDIQGLDTLFHRAGQGEFTLHGIKGDFCTADSYEPFHRALMPNDKKRFGPPKHSGKSCDGPDGWPYWNLQLPGEGGVIMAVGWPGQWASVFERDGGHGLRVAAGQQKTHLVLKPGEEIRTPLNALLFWRGDDLVRAQNLWRRWFIAHNLARTSGQPQPSVTQIQVDGSQQQIGGVKAFLDAGIKPDICWRDAGGGYTWYPNQTGQYQGNDAWLNTGTWEVDPTRYPQGFKPFSDWVRSNGMQFLLWFEPERVGNTNSWLALNHPEWLLPGSSHGSIFDLGNPTAFNWLVNHLDSMIQAQGLDWYREDMNGEGPLPAWRKHDAADRQGITENFYVQGHLALWDELRRRHPGLHIDSCASGGRRNDLESMRRAVPLLRSDFQFPEMKRVVEGNQGHTYGLSSWLPFQGTGCYLYEPYAFRSFYIPSFGMGGLSPENTAAQKQAYHECARIAPLMLGDYYPLSPYSLNEDTWIAWQFDRPDLGRGVIQAFRRAGNQQASRQFSLRGLQPKLKYEVENLDGSRQILSGRELMQQGLVVELKQTPAAAVIIYRRLSVTGK